MHPDKMPDAPVHEGVAFPKNNNKSTISRKKALRIVGGTVLAIAVAFGGGTALSQVPNTFSLGVGVATAPGNAGQSTQNTDSTATVSTNAAVLPDIGSDTVAVPAANSASTLPGTGNSNRFAPAGPGRGRAGGGR